MLENGLVRHIGFTRELHGFTKLNILISFDKCWNFENFGNHFQARAMEDLFDLLFKLKS